MDLPHALHRATPAELQERLAAERTGRPFLLLRDGDDAQRIIDLGEPARLTVGRAVTSDIALTWDAEVSRVHATLERIGEEWNLIDDGRSRNGSSVDGERVHGRRRLRDGDVIVTGRTTLVFRSPRAGRESLRTATSQRPTVPKVSDAQLRVLVALCRPLTDEGQLVPATNRQIAEDLVIGIETVKTHMTALVEQFGLSALPQHQKRAILAQRALQSGLVAVRRP